MSSINIIQRLLDHEKIWMTDNQPTKRTHYEMNTGIDSLGINYLRVSDGETGSMQA
jgi:hypothetical protein